MFRRTAPGDGLPDETSAPGRVNHTLPNDCTLNIEHRDPAEDEPDHTRAERRGERWEHQRWPHVFKL
jgi:hypothetical protein